VYITLDVQTETKAESSTKVVQSTIRGPDMPTFVHAVPLRLGQSHFPAEQLRLWQSRAIAQALPDKHGLQYGPPQSIAVSSTFFTPS
jgi:hypothetical protein